MHLLKPISAAVWGVALLFDEAHACSCFPTTLCEKADASAVILRAETLSRYGREEGRQGRSEKGLDYFVFSTGALLTPPWGKMGGWTAMHML